MSSALSFDFYPLRFEFRAEEPFHFPAASANSFRGAFGASLRRNAPAAYARIFEPHAHPIAASGFHDPPRPFVFRTRHLDGATIPAGSTFHVGLNFFVPSASLLDELIRAFSGLARQGFGPNCSRAALESVSIHSKVGDELRLVSLSLAPSQHPLENLRVDFLSPTELKDRGEIVDVPRFEILMRRIRDRVSTLRGLYGAGPLEIDHRALDKRAGLIRLGRFDTWHVSNSRRSSRTGQVHPLGGFIGFAEYEGDLSEFLPYLEIARWIGVGRQTVWGKGEIALHVP